MYRKTIENWVKIAYVMKLSDEDFIAVYKGRSIATLSKEWFNISKKLQLIVFTQGADGITAFTRDGQELHVPAVSVKVVDTIGAGDTVSAVICEMITKHSLAKICDRDNKSIGSNQIFLEYVLTRAAQAAAVCCSRAGAQPPTLNELSNSHE